ncbi:MAG TPA: hypothetical protein PK767_08300 [Clostridiales bacterium]|mgnify:CR=1 FL=1|nr:hypothetical protein [Clostridiales bacterium]HPP36226.1 hypothetical protein [Clostridiales bacterium]
MRQDFTGVTKEELSELFPVKLEKHDPAWKDHYAAEADFLRSVFGDTPNWPVQNSRADMHHSKHMVSENTVVKLRDPIPFSWR